jgi:hypothetical protein
MEGALMSPMRARRWAAAAATLVVAALVGCDSDGPAGQPLSTTPPVSSPASTPASASPAEGTWKSEPFGRTAIAKTLADAGLGKHVEQFFKIDETPENMVITIRIMAGQWTAYRAVGDGAAAVNDRGTYTIDGDTLLYRPNAGGLNTYRWSVAGDQLTLMFLSTSEPAYEGIPNDVFQRAFYTVVSFHRA